MCSKNFVLVTVVPYTLMIFYASGVSQSTLFVGFSLELISKLLKSFKDDDRFIRISG